MNDDRQLIADLLSALEYHAEQTRPIHSTTVAIQAAREHLRTAPAYEAGKADAREWRPIDSAPRDGSIFLCWVTAERCGETEEGQQYMQDVSQADFGWWVPGENRDYFDCGCGQIADRQYISYWQPLPPPPEQPK